MKSEAIKHLVTAFKGTVQEVQNIEYWSANELQLLWGSSKWENFEKVISKAIEACKNAGGNVDDHFPDIRKVIEAGKFGLRPENLPPAEDIQKVQRKLEGEDKKLLKGVKKPNIKKK